MWENRDGTLILCIWQSTTLWPNAKNNAINAITTINILKTAEIEYKVEVYSEKKIKANLQITNPYQFSEAWLR